MAAKQLKQYRAQRQISADRIQEIHDLALQAVTDASMKISLQIRTAELAAVYADFNSNHVSVIQILALQDDADFEAEKNYRAEIDRLYFSIKKINFELDQTAQVNTSVQKFSQVKLPKLNVPTFNSSLKGWPTFIDLFDSLIHNNDSLSDIEKFQYLLSVVSGEALSLIKNLPLTSDNYVIAYKNLRTRYQNERLLSSYYWDEIYNAPKLTNDSVRNLRHLLDTFSDNLNALKNLKFPVDSWDFVLFHLMSKKLDTETLRRFELEHASVSIPTYDKLFEFLEKQCIALDSMNLTKSPQKYNANANSPYRGSKPIHRFGPSQSTAALLAETNPQNKNCPVCKQPHTIYKCPAFASKSPNERYEITKRNNWCTKCLGNLHTSKTCKSRSLCRVCSGSSHHTLLHFDNSVTPSNSTPLPDNIKSVTSPETLSSEPISNQVNSMTNVLFSHSTVLLSTAQVHILDSRNNYQKVRVLLDSASQASFITEKCANRLGLPKKRLPLAISGIGHMSSTSSTVLTCTLKPIMSQSPSLTAEVAIIQKICSDMPAFSFSLEKWPRLANLQLADPNCNIPGPIDMLLGADVFSIVMQEGKLDGNNGEPTALCTLFGWILIGKMNFPHNYSPVQAFFSSCNPSLDNTLKLFWQLEEISQYPISTPEEVECEEHFQKTHSRTPCGRYIVDLPFKESEPHFSGTRCQALRRFHSLERRLCQNPSLHKEYSIFMRDYLESNHMEAVSPNSSFENTFYIPHHCVVNPNSTTTKLRVVFDASAKSPSGFSLNDSLMIGKKLQQDIVVLLLNFRLHSYVFTADIKQMYRQILINEKHRDYQRILWRFSPDDTVQDYRLNTVSFGVSSAPFLALRTLLQLAQDEQRNFPLAAKVLSSDVYVDDIITGANDLQTAHLLQTELISLLKKGGFQLHKWASNNPNLLQSFSSADCQQNPLNFDADDSIIKILGLKWCPSQDHFSYNVSPLDRSCTKRSILSEIARMFDPIGFLTPLVFFAKHLMQILWTLGLDWDATPPSNVLEKWNQYREELPCLSNIKISRQLYFHSPSLCEVHGFADSSEKGYAAVVYLRVMTASDDFLVQLIGGRSKVAPLKTVSIPRLELCAAVLLSNLMDLVIKTYSKKIKLTRIFAWTDSMVALYWIRSSPHRWKSFVSNRVSHIQDKISPNMWYHVPSAENPADCASRGLLPMELVQHSMWFLGPLFLRKPQEKWSIYLNMVPPATKLEEKTLSLTIFATLDYFDILLEKFSSLNKIKRIIAYCFRFIHNLRHPHSKLHDPFTQEELHKSLLVLVKRVQYTSFTEEILNIQNHVSLSKPFQKLNPFLDDDGILRVGGRLQHSGLSFERKHPALLPRKHRLTDLLIESIHRENFHPGLQTLHHLITQNFWILSPKRAIRHVISKCIRCFKFKPVPLEPPMGNLPALRVGQLKPFQCVGVDYGGPFHITLSKGRGIRSQKAYICLFICFATKAIHLELVSELSTDAFIAALRRFVGRRGRCSRIFSDCGTNFVGAHRVLSEYMQTAAQHENLSFHFNPPSAPHFNGLSEAGIKSVKSHLYRVIGTQILSYEEFYTLLVQIESLLNSRPLCPLSSDPNDLCALTPGHFLTLEPLTSLPDPDLSHLNLNKLSRWQLIQRLHQDIWKRWRNEYLHTLQQRQKWLKSDESLKVGDLVIIKNETSPPLHWRLGRVTQTHPGSDGIVRVATIRTQQGTLQRPLVKLCPLPCRDNN